MPYLDMLSDPGMNYTLNRPLLDGTSQARIKEIGAVAPQIKDYESWHTVWLGLAKRAEAEKAVARRRVILPRRRILNQERRRPGLLSVRNF